VQVVGVGDSYRRVHGGSEGRTLAPEQVVGLRVRVVGEEDKHLVARHVRVEVPFVVIAGRQEGGVANGVQPGVLYVPHCVAVDCAPV